MLRRRLPCPLHVPASLHDAPFACLRLGRRAFVPLPPAPAKPSPAVSGNTNGRGYHPQRNYAIPDHFNNNASSLSRGGSASPPAAADDAATTSNRDSNNQQQQKEENFAQIAEAIRVVFSSFPPGSALSLSQLMGELPEPIVDLLVEAEGLSLKQFAEQNPSKFKLLGGPSSFSSAADGGKGAPYKLMLGDSTVSRAQTARDRYYEKRRGDKSEYYQQNQPSEDASEMPKPGWPTFSLKRDAMRATVRESSSPAQRATRGFAYRHNLVGLLNSLKTKPLISVRGDFHPVARLPDVQLFSGTAEEKRTERLGVQLGLTRQLKEISPLVRAIMCVEGAIALAQQQHAYLTARYHYARHHHQQQQQQRQLQQQNEAAAAAAAAAAGDSEDSGGVTTMASSGEGGGGNNIRLAGRSNAPIPPPPPPAPRPQDFFRASEEFTSVVATIAEMVALRVPKTRNSSLAVISSSFSDGESGQGGADPAAIFGGSRPSTGRMSDAYAHVTTHTKQNVSAIHSDRKGRERAAGSSAVSDAFRLNDESVAHSHTQDTPHTPPQQHTESAEDEYNPVIHLYAFPRQWEQMMTEGHAAYEAQIAAHRAALDAHNRRWGPVIARRRRDEEERRKWAERNGLSAADTEVYVHGPSNNNNRRGENEENIPPPPEPPVPPRPRIPFLEGADVVEALQNLTINPSSYVFYGAIADGFQYIQFQECVATEEALQTAVHERFDGELPAAAAPLSPAPITYLSGRHRRILGSVGSGSFAGPSTTFSDQQSTSNSSSSAAAAAADSGDTDGGAGDAALSPLILTRRDAKLCGLYTFVSGTSRRQIMKREKQRKSQAAAAAAAAKKGENNHGDDDIAPTASHPTTHMHTVVADGEELPHSRGVKETPDGEFDAVALPAPSDVFASRTETIYALGRREQRVADNTWAHGDRKPYAVLRHRLANMVKLNTATGNSGGLGAGIRNPTVFPQIPVPTSSSSSSSSSSPAVGGGGGSAGEPVGVFFPPDPAHPYYGGGVWYDRIGPDEAEMEGHRRSSSSGLHGVLSAAPSTTAVSQQQSFFPSPQSILGFDALDTSPAGVKVTLSRMVVKPAPCPVVKPYDQHRVARMLPVSSFAPLGIAVARCRPVSTAPVLQVFLSAPHYFRFEVEEAASSAAVAAAPTADYAAAATDSGIGTVAASSSPPFRFITGVQFVLHSEYVPSELRLLHEAANESDRAELLASVKATVRDLGVRLRAGEAASCGEKNLKRRLMMKRERRRLRIVQSSLASGLSPLLDFDVAAQALYDVLGPKPLTTRELERGLPQELQDLTHGTNIKFYDAFKGLFRVYEVPPNVVVQCLDALAIQQSAAGGNAVVVPEDVELSEEGLAGMVKTAICEANSHAFGFGRNPFITHVECRLPRFVRAQMRARHGNLYTFALSMPQHFSIQEDESPTASARTQGERAQIQVRDLVNV